MTATAPMEDRKEAAVSKIETRAHDICKDAAALTIQSDEEAKAADEFLNKIINPLIKEGDELFDPMIQAAHNAHAVAIATKRKAVGGLPAAKLHIRNELGRWAQVVEDRAREERLRLEQEARDQEQARIAREVAAITEAGGPDIEGEIAAILEAPRPDLVLPPAAMVQATVPGARDVYDVEVVNLKEFYRAIGDGRIPVTLAKPDMGALKKRAGADKEGFAIPGCRLIKTKSVSSRRI